MPAISSKIKTLKARDYTRSSSFQMAVLFTVLCGMAVLALGYFSYYFTRGHFILETESIIDTEIKYISKYGEVPESDGSRLYALFDDEGKKPPVIPNVVSVLSEGIIVFDHPKNNRRYAAKIYTFPDRRKLLVGVDITRVDANYRFMQTLSVISIALMVLVIVASFFLSVFVVRGTNNIANTAREIMHTGDLSRRLEVSSRWDDLGNMALVLNSLLERIEQLMQDVRQVSDNIAHDLRTPLTRMRGTIEDLNKDRNDPACASLLQEADQLLATFNALLRISRIEAEKQTKNFTNLNLKDVVEDVIDFYEPLAEEKKIELNGDLNEAPFYGDRDLLFQAMANLLDNAIKFTPEGGKIEIDLSSDKNAIRLSIRDNGPGVPDDQLEKIFTRFYRADTSRHEPGSGLGLSLVAAVAELHGGVIETENINPGLEIAIVFLKM